MKFFRKIFGSSEIDSKKSFLEKTFWTKEKIGYLPRFPIVEIDHNDGDRIEVFSGIREFEGVYNHFLFENYNSSEFPTYYVDSNFNLLRLEFHKEKFNYPKYLKSIEKVKFLGMLRKCELNNIDDFNSLKSVKDIFYKLLKKDFKYNWETKV